MSERDDVFGDAERLRRFDQLAGFGAGEWTVAGCRVESEDIGFDEIRRRMDDTDVKSGWRCWTDRVERFVGGQWESSPKLLDRLLSAELALGDGRSVSIIHLHDDVWRWVMISESADGDCLKREVCYLSVVEGLSIVYAVYWRLNGEAGVYRPYTSRFIDFRDGEN